MDLAFVDQDHTGEDAADAQHGVTLDVGKLQEAKKNFVDVEPPTPREVP
ncbi:MAG TPA: hypothetical protein VGB92_11455 [Longimicrobium sp.]